MKGLARRKHDLYYVSRVQVKGEAYRKQCRVALELRLVAPQFF